MKTETVIFDIVVPHPAPINIAELLADIEAVIKRHVILSDHAAAALAVWVLHTWAFELRDTVAYVAIESPEKRCGKTTLLSVLAAMACKSLIASNITVGALFRAIHTCTPTLFIDEADTFLAGNSIMRGIINSGNTRRTAYVLRLSAGRKGRPSLLPVDSAIKDRPLTPALSPDGGEGDGRDAAHACDAALPNKENVAITGSLPRAATSTLAPPESSDTGLKKYSCWCPKVISMIGEVPDTIADRSIVVKMARKLTTETCLPLAALDTAEIKAKCMRFALDMGHFISAAPKIHGEGLNDRATDTFDPLFVIARLASDEWEQKLRAAAVALSNAADIENSDSGLILDIVDIFVASGSEKMFSRDIVAQLRDGGMKSQTLKYSSVNEHQIARILRPYGVKPKAMRVGKEVRNGYDGSDFRDALHRYVSEEDIRAHVELIRHRCQLQEEARVEAARQEALMRTLETMIRERKIVTEYEIKEMALKLKQDDMADAALTQKS
jgi:hypothetical protein